MSYNFIADLLSNVSIQTEALEAFEWSDEKLDDALLNISEYIKVVSASKSLTVNELIYDINKNIIIKYYDSQKEILNKLLNYYIEKNIDMVVDDEWIH